MKPAVNAALAGLVALATTMAAGAPARAQSAGAVPARADSVPEPLGRSPHSRMHTLLQKTVFKVDVLTVDVCFDAATAARFAALAARGPLRGAAADSVTRTALAADRAAARIELLRDVSLKEFLEGMDEDLRKAVAAGLLADTVYRALAGDLPRHYAPLAARGFRKGDRLLYVLAPDSLRASVVNREGATLLERNAAGRARRNAALATWLAPGSDFRNGLLRSLQRAGGVGGKGDCGAGG